MRVVHGLPLLDFGLNHGIVWMANRSFDEYYYCAISNWWGSGTCFLFCFVVRPAHSVLGGDVPFSAEGKKR